VDVTPQRIDEASARAIVEFARREGRVYVSMHEQIHSEQIGIVRRGWFRERFRVTTTSFSADALADRGATTTEADMDGPALVRYLCARNLLIEEVRGLRGGTWPTSP
jgi:hypothetical protein